MPALPRPLARPGVVLLAALAALVASLAVATTASAHVTVVSSDAAPGGYGKLTFRVPNESDTASTVSLRISIPPESAMASLRYQPQPGWTVTTTTSDLEEPLESHGREIPSYVSVVEFRAEEGAGIRPGEFAEFSLSGGPFPDAEQLSFPAVQTYSDGTEAAWIEPTVEGSPEPERPAPALALTAGTAGGHGTAEGEGAVADTDATGSSAADDGGSATATTALVLAVLGLLAGLGGLALGWTARRRTVAS